ncbi:RecQ family ATP-dependent DNA helicase [Chitinophaga horti]|uniref:ATP-dependent DNA helicase RecQ n=1 Tax=Chitinophaga horti TaxID=2920382 RepID=A0ABY6J534_9BACT|nr:ATP-dependent DNA helicase RecQ [Chitinophaga horti]UYQ93294.1 RecQ family ATP-dependent DNA helicase [Chitinophaga horti]
MGTPVSILQKYWGYDQFRPLQEDIVNSVLEGNDTLALLPTGGGKSICFQVPAMMLEGVCLVVTPLIALMKDQVQQLEKRGIPAMAIYAGMYFKDVEKVMDLARNGKIKFLYISPERLQSPRFQAHCETLDVGLIAVDEAHCISQWGYDFRPAYLKIAEIRNFFPRTPILALTATATLKVREDICEKLEFTNQKIFTKSFVRSNLSYSVFEEEAKVNRIRHILDRVPGSAVVYCRNRRHTKEIAGLLQSHGINADYYHAGLPAADRATKQDDWITGRTRVVVCTNAFGMGIDKPDVRSVIHYDVPDSLEAYYQEAGRAGRDEQKAYGVLLYTQQELTEMKSRIPLQFPQLEEIREVYQGVVNYLQVPIGSAENVYFDFDINDFARKFALNITMAYSAMRILEHEGVVQLSESVYLPSRVEFITNKETLWEYERHGSSLEPLIKALLRTYQGIFDHPVPVFEKQLMRILRTDEDTITDWLQRLHRQGIIRYQQRKDEPQLCFLQERVPVQYLRVDMLRIAERRRIYEAKIDSVTRYATNTDICRTQSLVTYFGEAGGEPCGVCDVCLRKKTGGLTAPKFDQLAPLVLAQLEQPLTFNLLADALPGVKEDLLLDVLEFMLAEEMIVRDKDGMIRRK